MSDSTFLCRYILRTVMSSAISYLFSTHRESAIKTLSNKPLRVTAKDAAIVAALTVVATLLILWAYWTATDAPDDQRQYVSRGVTAAAIAVGAQFIYEYTGTNNRIAENSLRYAKGTTLDKYISARESVLQRGLRKVAGDDATSRYKILKIALRHPDLIDVARDKRELTSDHDVHKVEQLRTLSATQLSKLQRDIERMTEASVDAILRNGFGAE